jgi:hypothetical protein
MFLRKLAHRLGRSPLRVCKSHAELFTEMEQEFRYPYADRGFEQLAPEDAYLSCKLKQCNWPSSPLPHVQADKRVLDYDVRCTPCHPQLSHRSCTKRLNNH